MWFLNRVFHHDKYRRSVLLLFVQLDCVQHQFGGPELVGYRAVGYRAVDNLAVGPGLVRLADIGSDSVGRHPDRARFEFARLEFVGFEIADS